MIAMQYFAPAPALRAHVSGYYFFHARLAQISDVLRADMPQLRFMLSGRGQYQFVDGKRIDTPEIALKGATSGATHFDVAGPVLVFGIALMPAGWASLVRADASAHGNAVMDATAVLGPQLEDALDGMRSTLEVAEMVGIADALMLGLVARAAPAPLAFTRIADAWLTGAPSPDIDALMAATGLSVRQLERLTNRIYGAPPKLLARKYRALRVASAMACGDADWREKAVAAFYDQSHMIREIRHFTGLTPGQLLTSPTPVTRIAYARRELAGILPRLAVES